MGWLAGWNYRKPLVVDHTNVDSGLTDFPLRIKIDNDADMAEALANGHDFRLTQDDGETLCAYERETWSGGGGSNLTADVWGKAPSISAVVDTNLYGYYGNAGAADGEDVANVWDANFKGVFHLGENGGPYVDSTGTLTDSRSGTDPTRASGVVGYGQDFEADNHQYIEIADNAALDFGGQNGTWEVWCFFETLSYLFSRWAGGSNNNVLFRTNGSTSWQAYLQTNAQIGGNFSAGIDLPSTGTWFHLAIVYDNGVLKLYVNGTPSSTTYSSGQNLHDVAVGFRLGYYAYSAKYADGLLEELRLSNTNRSAAWIKFEYRNIFEADNELAWGAEETQSVSYDLTASDAAHAHAAESPALTQRHELTASESTHAHATDSPAITQVHELGAVACAHAHAAGEPLLSRPSPAPYRAVAGRVWHAGAAAAGTFSAGARAGDDFHAGAVAGQVL